MNTENTFRLKKQIVSLLVVVLLALATIVFLHKYVAEIDLASLIEILRNLKIEYLGLSLILLVGYVVVQGSCVAGITKTLGYNIPLFRYTAYYSADQYFSSITPAASGGQPAALYFMTRDGVPASKATTSVILNTVLYISSLIIMGLLVLIFAPFLIFSGGKVMIWLFFVGLGLNILLVLLCLFCMYYPRPVRVIVLAMISILAKIRLIKKPDEKKQAFENMLEDYKGCVETAGKNRFMLVRVFFLNILSRLCLLSVTFAVYRSLGLSEHSYLQIISVQIISTITVNSLPVPGGIGAAEGVFLNLYKDIFPGDNLMPAMLINRSITYYILFILCGLYTVIYYVTTARKRRKPK